MNKLGQMYFPYQFLFAIILKNSFGSTYEFKNSKIIGVPKDCSDLSDVVIDEIRTNCENDFRAFYVIYGKHSMFVRVEGITKDNFPIVRLKDQPKYLDSKHKTFLKRCHRFEKYVFNHLTYGLKNGTQIQFIGFNYLWLGCPQSLCLSPKIDAATRLPNGTVYLFRGNYYWNLDSTPLVGRAHKISEWQSEDKGHDPGLDFYLGYFNAVVSNSNFTSFYRGNQQFIWDSGKFDKKTLQLSPSEFQFKMDAAFHVMNGTKGITYDIRGDKLVSNRNPFSVNPIKEVFGIPWDRVDASFTQNQTIYLFRDWYYISLSENIEFPIKPKLVFKDIYKCPEVLYKEFGGYNTFLNKFLSLEVSQKENEIKGQVFNDNEIGFVVIIMFAIISVLIFMVLRKKSKHSKYLF